jgi:hypothetical protein
MAPYLDSHAAKLLLSFAIPSKNASRFHHACSNPHNGQREYASTSGRERKLWGSVSMPVEMNWPVFGHLTIIALM